MGKKQKNNSSETRQIDTSEDVIKILLQYKKKFHKMNFEFGYPIEENKYVLYNTIRGIPKNSVISFYSNPLENTQTRFQNIRQAKEYNNLLMFKINFSYMKDEYGILKGGLKQKPLNNYNTFQTLSTLDHQCNMDFYIPEVSAIHGFDWGFFVQSTLNICLIVYNMSDIDIGTETECKFMSGGIFDDDIELVKNSNLNVTGGEMPINLSLCQKIFDINDLDFSKSLFVWEQHNDYNNDKYKLFEYEINNKFRIDTTMKNKLLSIGEFSNKDFILEQ